MSRGSGFVFDARYSYSRADRLMAGSSGKHPDSPSGSDSEIENLRTINQFLNLSLDYAITPRWSVSVDVPLVMRDHAHTFDSSVGAPFVQQSRFSGLGDARFLARYSLDSNEPDAGSGLRFGLKLPTGAIDKVMTPPDPADPTTPYKLERSSQPGTGSTDGILGGYYFRNAPDKASGWFISGQIQSTMRIKDQYRPGTEVSLDVGGHYELGEGVNALLQLNGQHRARDSGANANPASGGYSWNLSPGLSFAVTPRTQIYGFLQVPMVQYKNSDPADSSSGQLASRWTISIGLTERF